MKFYRWPQTNQLQSGSDDADWNIKNALPNDDDEAQPTQFLLHLIHVLSFEMNVVAALILISFHHSMK